jgi:hypothetical protein
MRFLTDPATDTATLAPGQSAVEVRETATNLSPCTETFQVGYSVLRGVGRRGRPPERLHIGDWYGDLGNVYVGGGDP